MNILKYLFLDVQYNCTYKNEIIEVSAVSTDHDGAIKNTFSRLVRPDHLDKVSPKLLKKMEISSRVLKRSVDIHAVMNTFRETYPKFDILIMWDIKMYDIFISKMTRYNIDIPQHKFLSLKEIIKSVDIQYYDSMTMQDASFIYDVYKVSNIERSRNNVQTIVSIFNVVRKLYLNKYMRGEITAFRKIPHSDIIHTSDCHYIHGKSEVEMVALSEVFTGKRFCKICSKKNRFPILPMRDISHKNFNRGILEMCSQYKMTANFDDENNIVIINSGIAYWKIYHSNGNIVDLYHENYHLIKATHFKCTCVEVRWDIGFHRQKAKLSSVAEAIRYIHDHDTRFKKKNKSISTYHCSVTYDK